MKLKIIYFLFLVLVIFSLAGYGYLKSAPGIDSETDSYPEIEIIPKRYDFGKIKFGDIVSYNFTIRNSGSEDLKIRRVSTSCLCATAKVEKEIIKPGEETILLVSYDSGSMGLHGKGKQERIIFIRSNDPISPQAEAIIYANVE